MKKVISGKICDTNDAILLEKDPDGIVELYDSKNGYLFIVDKLIWDDTIFLLDFDKYDVFKSTFPSGNICIFIGKNARDKNGVFITCSMFNKVVEFKKQQLKPK